MQDFVFKEFKAQIEKQGMAIDSIDETGMIFISKGELTLRISLDNLRKDYERDKDEAYIAEFVETVISYATPMPAGWEEAKNDVYISLFPNDAATHDFIFKKISDVFGKIYVHSGQNKFSWITEGDLKTWNITERELDEQANVNADKLLANTEISFDTVENRKLGLIQVEQTSLKAALLFAPSMKEKISAEIGFPFYAVIPVRDFCYIFSEEDFDFFASRLGKVVVDEYKKSGYAITTEILKFSDKGVEAVGRYPVE